MGWANLDTGAASILRVVKPWWSPKRRKSFQSPHRRAPSWLVHRWTVCRESNRTSPKLLGDFGCSWTDTKKALSTALWGWVCSVTQGAELSFSHAFVSSADDCLVYIHFFPGAAWAFQLTRFIFCCCCCWFSAMFSGPSCAYYSCFAAIPCISSYVC